MKQLTKENTRKELEQIALKEIMNQADKFTIKNIMLAMRLACDDSISTEEIEGVVYDAFEFALSEGYIDFVGQFTYMADPIKQIKFLNEETISV